MKKMVKTFLILMLVFTAIYVSAMVYANNSIIAHDYDGKYYACGKYYKATLYAGEPTEWYYPQDLGIIQIRENSATSLAVSIPLELDPGDLEIRHPIFKYNDTFYQIKYAEAVWDAGLPENINKWQIPLGAILGLGWVSAGALSIRWRNSRKIK